MVYAHTIDIQRVKRFNNPLAESLVDRSRRAQSFGEDEKSIFNLLSHAFSP